MKNHQRKQKQQNSLPIEQIKEYQQIQNALSDRYQSNNINYISPIQSSNNINDNITNNYYQGDIIYNKSPKVPEILYNNEGKPVSTLEYIKSQKDIEHLDFINTLIRLKTGSNATESSNIVNSNQNVNANALYGLAPSFQKEASTIAINNDDSKSYIKEILDICGESPLDQSPKKSQGLKRNDLIEITNRRKKMVDMPNHEEIINAKHIEQIDQNKDKDKDRENVIKEIEPIEIKPSIQSNVNAHSNNNDNENDVNFNQRQLPNAKNSLISKSNKKIEPKGFNNQKNIKQIEDMLRETKKIETTMIIKQDLKSHNTNPNINNNNKQTKVISDYNLKPNSQLSIEGDNSKKQHSVNKVIKQGILNKEPNEEHRKSKDKVSSSSTNKNKDSKSSLKNQGNHKVSLSSNIKTLNSSNLHNAKSKSNNNIEIASCDIKIKSEKEEVQDKDNDKDKDIVIQKKIGESISFNQNYYSNILASSSITNNAKLNKSKDSPQIDNNNNNQINNDKEQEKEEEESPIEKAEINLFEDEGDLNICTNEKYEHDRKSTALKSKIAQSIQPITEKQIEFDIDELLHPKYLFKTNHNSINNINNANSNTNANTNIINNSSSCSNSTKRQPQTVKKIQQRNPQSVSNIEHQSQKTMSKEINFKPPHMTKINTTKVLPSYNNKKQKQKSNVDQRVLTTSPSKPIPKTSKTPTSKDTGIQKNKFTFEPRKSKESISNNKYNNNNEESSSTIQLNPVYSQRNNSNSNSNNNN